MGEELEETAKGDCLHIAQLTRDWQGQIDGCCIFCEWRRALCNMRFQRGEGVKRRIGKSLLENKVQLPDLGKMRPQRFYLTEGCEHPKHGDPIGKQLAQRADYRAQICWSVLNGGMGTIELPGTICMPTDFRHKGRVFQCDGTAHAILHLNGSSHRACQARSLRLFEKLDMKSLCVALALMRWQHMGGLRDRCQHIGTNDIYTTNKHVLYLSLLSWRYSKPEYNM